MLWFLPNYWSVVVAFFWQHQNFTVLWSVTPGRSCWLSRKAEDHTGHSAAYIAAQVDCQFVLCHYNAEFIRARRIPADRRRVRFQPIGRGRAEWLAVWHGPSARAPARLCRPPRSHTCMPNAELSAHLKSPGTWCWATHSVQHENAEFVFNTKCIWEENCQTGRSRGLTRY